MKTFTPYGLIVVGSALAFTLGCNVGLNANRTGSSCAGEDCSAAEDAAGGEEPSSNNEELTVSASELTLSGSGTTASPYTVTLAAGYSDTSLSFNTTVNCTGAPDWVTISGTTLRLAPGGSVATTATLVCSAEGYADVTIAVTVGSPSLAFSGNSASSAPISQRVFHENASPAYTLTGTCNEDLGDVRLAGDIGSIDGDGTYTDASHVASCDGGTFSIAVNQDTTVPYFTPYRAGKDLTISQANGALTASTRLFKYTEAQGYQEISSAADLQTYLINNAVVTLILSGDIDMSDISATGNWTVVANFFGAIAGNGYSIDNLHINQAGNTFHALANTSISDVTNLTFNNPTILAGGGAGILAVSWADAGSARIISNVTVNNITMTLDTTGWAGSIAGAVTTSNTSTFLRNLSASGTISATNGNDQVGGLIGQTSSSNLMAYNLTSTVNISTAGNDVGGVIGRQGVFGATITNATWSGTITGTDYAAGGVIGHMDNTTTLSRSYSSGTVSGTNSSIGGLVGYATTTGAAIENCYNTASATSTSGTSVGGLLGNTTSNASITNSYTTGDTSGSSTVGRLMGGGSGSTTITNSYYLSTSTCTGCDVAVGTSKSSAQLQDENEFTSWDFDNIWQIDASYPTLR